MMLHHYNEMRSEKMEKNNSKITPNTAKASFNKGAKTALTATLMVSSLLGGANAVTAKTYENPKDVTSIVAHPKASTDTTEKMPAKYAFIGHFIEGKTTVKPFGKGAKLINVDVPNGTDAQPRTAWTWSDPSDDLKGQIGVVYQNVGTYKGKQVDLKITVTDWKAFKTNSEERMFSYYENQIGHRTGGLSSVSQTWTYVDHETGKDLKLEGTYFNFLDMDAKQTLRFTKGTTDKIAKIYVKNDSKVYYREKDNGTLEVGDWTNENFPTSVDYGDVTMAFEGGSIHFAWDRDYEGAESDPDSKPEDHMATFDRTGNQYMGYQGKKPVATETIDPTKLVSDSDEKEEESNTLLTRDEVYEYSVFHSVLDENEEFYFESYEMTDKLINGLALDTDKIVVTNEEGDDVTDWFNNESSGNTIKLVAKADTLKNPNFYGDTYKYNFDVKVDDTADLEKYKQKDGSYVLPNKAQVNIDGDEKSSNETKTTYPKLEKPSIKKFNVKDGEKTEDLVSVDEGKQHNYKVDVQIGNEKTIKEFTISDDLEDVLDIKAVKILDGDKDVTTEGKLKIDEDKESFTWTPNDAKKFIGKALTADITADLKEAQDLSPYNKDGKIIIPNTANLVVDDDKLPSNTVDITTTGVEPKAEKFNVADGENTKEEVNLEAGAKHKYELDFTVSNTEKLSELTLSDDLNNNMDIKDGSVKIFVGDKDVTGEGTLAIDDKEEKFTWKAKDPQSFAGKKLKVVIDAQVKEKVDGEGLQVKDENVVIPNVGEMTINKKEVPTNEVVVLVPPTPIDPEKATAEKFNADGKITKDTQVVKLGGEHKYQLKYSIPTIDEKNEKLKSFVIADDLEDVLDYKSVKVTVDGKDVTKEGKLVVDDEAEKFTWTPNDATKFAGKTILVDVVSELKKDADLKPYGLVPASEEDEAKAEDTTADTEEKTDDATTDTKDETTATDDTTADTEEKGGATTGSTLVTDETATDDATADTEEKTDEVAETDKEGSVELVPASGIPNTATIKVNDDDEIKTNTVMVVTEDENVPPIPTKPKEDPKEDPKEPANNTTTPTTPENGNTTTTPNKGVLPQTGSEAQDDTNLMLGSLAGVFAIALGGLVWLKRRNKNNGDQNA